MKIASKYFIFVCAVLLLCVLFVVPASAATDDGTGIFVGGIRVTDQNQNDILGDGTASFDSTTQTLTLTNYRAKGVVRTDEGGSASENALSVYAGVGQSAITVVITGDCRFEGGIVNTVGKVEVKDANITFASSVPTCIFARNGAIEILNSKIKLEGVTFMAPLFNADEMAIGFFGNEIAMKDCRFILDIDECEAYNLNRLDALFCAVQNVAFEGCRFDVHTPFPVFNSLFQAYSGALAFSQCKFSLSGQMYCFLANGEESEETDLQDESAGAVWLEGCRVRVKNSYHLLGGSTVQIRDCNIKASLYRTGLLLASGNDKDYYIFNNSKINLTALSVERMEKDLWRPYWKALSDSEKAIYGSFEAFALASGKTEAENKPDTFGIFVQNGVSFFEETRITVRGFDYGYFACGMTLAKCLEGAYLDISADKAAFTVFSVYADALQHDVDVTYSRSELQDVALPIGTNSEIGTVVYGMAKKGESLILKEEKAFTSAGEVLDVLEGNRLTVRIVAEGAFNPAVIWVSLGLVVFVVAFVTACVFVLSRRPITKEDETQS